MTRYLLSAHSFACEVGRGAVFLDLRKDKYLAVAADDLVLLRGLIRGWPGLSDERVDRLHPNATEEESGIVRTLLQEGLLTDDEALGKDAKPALVEPVSATIDAVWGPYPTMTLQDFCRFLRAWAITSTLLKYFPLRRVIARVHRRKLRRNGGGFNLLEARRLKLAYFLVRSNFFSPHDACLRDSLTLIEFLAQYDLYPTWVFGVKLEPFAAHSWVQEGPTVLNDQIAHVRSFAPILAV